MRLLLPAVFIMAAVPWTAQAQVEGLRVEGGPVWLTRSGSLHFGTSSIRSNAGVAVRGRLRYGVGALAIAGEVQASFQGYDAEPAGPIDTLDATWLGATVSLAPIRFGGVAPYAEVGLGKLFFKDDAIDTRSGTTASVYGLGVAIAGRGRLGFDAALRLVRRDGLRAPGVVDDFKYDPKTFAVMLSLRL